MSLVQNKIKKSDSSILIVDGPSEDEIFASLRERLPLKLKFENGGIFDASIESLIRRGSGIWDVSGNIKNVQSKAGEFFRGNGNFEATFYTNSENRFGRLYFHLM